VSEHVRVETTIDGVDGATTLARSVVEARLAACAQVVGPIASTYRWEGAVTTDQEWLVVMKTAADRLDDLVAHLRAAHPYDVPEIVATPVVGGNPDYLSWLTTETRDR
jgi:periplasmic divalent cation tolerance protein